MTCVSNLGFLKIRVDGIGRHGVGNLHLLYFSRSTRTRDVEENINNSQEGCKGNLVFGKKIGIRKE
jgi:hypothetical protein